nr:cell adhesion molecule Dscam2-like [Cherax quadricarinatus]
MSIASWRGSVRRPLAGPCGPETETFRCLGYGKYHALLDGRLLVHDVKAADSYATYRCRVLHTLTSTTAASNTARIIVHDPREKQAPRMVTKSTTVKLSDTQPMVLPCVAHAHPPPEYR